MFCCDWLNNIYMNSYSESMHYSCTVLTCILYHQYLQQILILVYWLYIYMFLGANIARITLQVALRGLYEVHKFKIHSLYDE